jgi:hypothetical protein
LSAEDRAFAVASDEALVALIRSARRRLIVIAPALSKRTAEALAARPDDLDALDVRVILDADPEVWRARPPDYMTRWGRNADVESLTAELRNRAGEVFDKMVAFDPPTVRLVEKNISPRNVADPAFLGPLRRIMERQRVPKDIIDTLFSTGDAAPESGRLL